MTSVARSATARFAMSRFVGVRRARIWTSVQHRTALPSTPNSTRGRKVIVFSATSQPGLSSPNPVTPPTPTGRTPTLRRELSLDLKPFPWMNPTSQDLSELRVSDFLLQLSSSGTPTCSSEYHRLLLLLFVYSPGQWCSCSCGVILVVVVVVVMVVVLCLAVTVGRRTVLSAIDSWLMVETAGGTGTNDCEPVRDGAAIVFASRGTRLVSASNRLRRGSSVTGKGSSERLSRSSAASGDRPPLAAILLHSCL
uniref:Uncharacterized protein n=1 Tax=Anopheles merus TaxID=30066 RepID=A0A182VDI2_ANOME